MHVRVLARVVFLVCNVSHCRLDLLALWCGALTLCKLLQMDSVVRYILIRVVDSSVSVRCSIDIWLHQVICDMCRLLEASLRVSLVC